MTGLDKDFGLLGGSKVGEPNPLLDALDARFSRFLSAVAKSRTLEERALREIEFTTLMGDIATALEKNQITKANSDVFLEESRGWRTMLK